MSVSTKRIHNKDYLYLEAGRAKTLLLGPAGSQDPIDFKTDRVKYGLDYLLQNLPRYMQNINVLLALLPESERKQYIGKFVKASSIKGELVRRQKSQEANIPIASDRQISIANARSAFEIKDRYMYLADVLNFHDLFYALQKTGKLRNLEPLLADVPVAYILLRRIVEGKSISQADKVGMKTLGRKEKPITEVIDRLVKNGIVLISDRKATLTQTGRLVVGILEDIAEAYAAQDGSLTYPITTSKEEFEKDMQKRQKQSKPSVGKDILSPLAKTPAEGYQEEAITDAKSRLKKAIGNMYEREEVLRRGKKPT